MRLPSLVACLLVFISVTAVLGDEDVRVVRPSNLASQWTGGKIPHTPALFGVPPYRTAVQGILVYPTSNVQGCNAFVAADLPGWTQVVDPDTRAPTKTIIIMVDRGGCTFGQKVRNAGAVPGAVSVIVADDRDESNLPFMADDGATAVETPSVMINKVDSNKLKQYLTDNPTAQVIISLQYSIPNPDNVVEWTMWTTINDPSSKEFKKTFSEAMHALNASVEFTPHFYLLSGDSNGCTDPSLPCSNQCTNKGRYCSADPDGDLETGLSGANIVRETVRSICVWQVATAASQQWRWFDYTAKFEETCKDENWSPACSLRVADSVGVDADAVNLCIGNAGGYEENTDGPNTILEAELAAKAVSGIFTLPFIYVNNVPYHGGLSCPSPIDIRHCGVLGIICSGYDPQAVPAACRSPAGCPLGVFKDKCGVCGGDGDIDVCGVCHSPKSYSWGQSCLGCDNKPNSGVQFDACGVCGGTGSVDACGRCLQKDDPMRIDGTDTSKCDSSSSSGGMSIGGIIGIIIGCVLVAVIGVYIYMRRQNNRMRDDIDSLLKQYLPLEGTSHGAAKQSKSRDITNQRLITDEVSDL